jgi:hypothetical protein
MINAVYVGVRASLGLLSYRPGYESAILNRGPDHRHQPGSKAVPAAGPGRERRPCQTRRFG